MKKLLSLTILVTILVPTIIFAARANRIENSSDSDDDAYYQDPTDADKIIEWVKRGPSYQDQVTQTVSKYRSYFLKNTVEGLQASVHRGDEDDIKYYEGRVRRAYEDAFRRAQENALWP